MQFNAKINQDDIAVAEVSRLSEVNKIVVFLVVCFFLLPHLSPFLSVCKAKSLSINGVISGKTFFVKCSPFRCSYVVTQNWLVLTEVLRIA